MGKDKDKHEIRSIKDFEEFKRLKEHLKDGFVIDKEGSQITNPAILDLSEKIAKALYQATKFRQRSDTINQFRKFFNEVRGLKNLKEHTDRLSVALRMLKARMGYAAGRETISQDFSEVINTCINKMLELGDFAKHIDGFCDFFEALYAYYYYHTKVR